MLVLSRKPGEQIVIEGGITVTVVEVNGNRVRLGITAPPDVCVLRSELAGQWDGLPQELCETTKCSDAVAVSPPGQAVRPLRSAPQSQMNSKLATLGLQPTSSGTPSVTLWDSTSTPEGHAVSNSYESRRQEGNNKIGRSRSTHCSVVTRES